jgi:predicted RNA-binding protein YlqC (UPF0109 family)
LRTLLATLAKGLASEPSKVHVHQHEEDGVVHLEIEVSRADRGRVIGKGGRTIYALRRYLDAVADRAGLQCEVDVRE